jgi:hypothetical protein
MWLNPGEILQGSQGPLVSRISRISSSVEFEIFAIIDCYTPSGQLIKVEARDAAHAAFLILMNSKSATFPHITTQI